MRKDQVAIQPVIAQLEIICKSRYKRLTKYVAHLKEYFRLCLTLFQIDPQDYAVKLHTWMKEGFKELGDLGGMGIGKTTSTILRHPDFQADPHMVCFSLITVSRG